MSTGEAAAALLGSVEHLEYTLVGDTVNLAARVMGKTPVGHVWATRDGATGVVGVSLLASAMSAARRKCVSGSCA